MARRDPHNHSEYWTDPEFAGISLLKADFRNFQYAPHAHDELVIAVTVNGAGKSVTQRGTDVSTKGQLLVYNPGEAHQGGTIEQPGWQYRAFYIDNLGIAALATALSHRKAAPVYFNHNCIQDQRLARVMQHAHTVFEESRDPAEKQSCLLDAINALHEHHGEPRFEPETLGNEASPVSSAVEYIQANFSSPITIAELARLTRLSEFYFLRVFRKHRGISPYAFLVQVRLKAARRFLENGLSSAETAVSSGFFDQSHFVRHFKRVYGITPSQFTRTLRKPASPFRPERPSP
ncbi:AraC family transcriptional regulator [Aquabacterium sp. A7-Y]|uniref:AraC family transcriptional regulator n=1 Tax=Aquabacterium sp. A7-Y TaxID=1349605 RepID=UPI00223D8FF4|nr:AraC family transcriptional regulator [Aquabacterium sp. A7-Y]MCW7536875.1 AraC family transcriptional regulator [Aquabacterium sp. A7-Y]